MRRRHVWRARLPGSRVCVTASRLSMRMRPARLQFRWHPAGVHAVWSSACNCASLALPRTDAGLCFTVLWHRAIVKSSAPAERRSSGAACPLACRCCCHRSCAAVCRVLGKRPYCASHTVLKTVMLACVLRHAFIQNHITKWCF